MINVIHIKAQSRRGAHGMQFLRKGHVGSTQTTTIGTQDTRHLFRRGNLALGVLVTFVHIRIRAHPHGIR